MLLKAMAVPRWGLVVAVRLTPWIGYQTAKFKVMIFAKSKKQASGANFQFFSDLLFLKPIASFISMLQPIVPPRFDIMSSLNGAHVWLALGLYKSF